MFGLDLNTVSLIVGTLCVVLLFSMWQIDKKNTFNAVDFVLDANGKADLTKAGQIVALAVSSWGFVYEVREGKLTEFYLGIYMSAWTAAAGVVAYLQSKAQKP